MKRTDILNQFESTMTLPDFSAAINTMGVGLTVVDATNEELPLIYVNQGFVEMTGYSKTEVLNKNCRFLQGNSTDQKEVDKVRKAINRANSTAVVLKNYRKDGSYFWNQFIISPVHDTEGELAYFIGLQFDVTEEIEEKNYSNKKMKELSNFDRVTGLMNLDFFKKHLQEAIDQEEQGTVLRINLKRFRNVNNTYGEALSDKILVQVAERLRQVCSSPICRSFADDFIILYSNNQSLEDILTVLEHKLSRSYLLQGEEIQLDYSIGISKFPENGLDVESLLAFASLAMKQAKQFTTRQYAYFDLTLSEQLTERMRIEKRFQHALELNEFSLHYQPKYTVESELRGMEALIRWNDPVVGMISPANFIPIAEETGFIIELGEWVMRTACAQNKRWQEEGLAAIPVSVNVSAVQFVHPNFVDKVEQVLIETGLSPALLELEITESLLIDPDHIITKLHKLKGLGISISIDDFGTGYSSINYLKDFPVDTLKIDRSFIVNVPGDKRDAALLHSIMQLGKSLGLIVLIEGVETKEQLQFFKEHDGDLIQGYYFSKPLAVDAMMKKLIGNKK
ncbi:bifunctional diguanylate cyclase/phosphodiesterase [Paraliobacillus sediminis]|uniref:bifunctional diguanylate cyclase/phosphodiesterase n=1 Tax=Paraliobacillus sediminis TaxID=1885916 RepID=UPI001F082D65|nr:bifunctional diguanylate cyclase/phosphodiesterase [Paraliobacillus sediminis]